MPTITTRRATGAPVQRAWEALAYRATLPSYIPEIASVDVLWQDADRQGSRWRVRLGEALLGWQEEAVVDHAAHRIDFAQTHGDLAALSGHWLVRAEGAGSVLELRLDFEAGIPLLDTMVHPIAEGALREFTEAALDRIAERVAVSAAIAR
ncbi:ribosome-associated toxin RatA of RatAB toxin-antitoxin module [Streptomyces sp. V4I8]|uniref:type II toxin-antitoxin system RatA family toxin n=1 Tax=Streptomyces sp. V4I8 TaxID=3156469 RepID=UPI003518BA7F